MKFPVARVALPWMLLLIALGVAPPVRADEVGYSSLTGTFSTVEALKDTTEGLAAEGFVSAIIFAGVGFGIYRKSRIAAVSGLALYLVGRGYAWVKVGPNLGVIPMLITPAFLHGVRGTFAYHKLPPRPEGLPSLAEILGALERNPAESEKVAGKGQDGKAAGD